MGKGKLILWSSFGDKAIGNWKDVGKWDMWGKYF